MGKEAEVATIVFGIPPSASVWHYYAGVAYLSAYLQALGHNIVQQPVYISALEDVLLRANPAVGSALKTIRNPNRTFHELVEANRLIEQASKDVRTKDFFRIERNNVRYISNYFDGTIEGAFSAVINSESNLFYHHFLEVTIPKIMAIKPDIYGISVADEHMLIPALILASMIREILPGTLVVLGGNYWPRILDAYKETLFVRLFEKCCHAIVWAEGYIPMTELADCLDPSKASGTIFLNEGGKLQMNPRSKTPIEFEDLPTPIYSTALSPWLSVNVPLLFTISNCNRRCGFCAIPIASDTYECNRVRCMSSEHIVRDIVALGAKQVDFGDEALPIETQLSLGSLLKTRQYSLDYCCYMTFDQRLLDLEICRQLHRSGLRIAQLGLESFSEETLKQEGKAWNKPDTYGQIIRNLAEAGIQVHVFYITGIPGELLSASIRMISFLEKYSRWITTVKTGRYRLAKCSRDATKDRQSAYIEAKEDNQKLHLNLNFKYRPESGITNKKVCAMNTVLEAICRTHWAYGITSQIHWCERLRYPREKLLALAEVYGPEEMEQVDSNNLKQALVKIETMVKKDLGLNVTLSNLDDIIGLALKHFPI